MAAVTGRPAAASPGELPAGCRRFPASIACQCPPAAESVSKGLQRKCVIVGGLFSEGQGNINHDLRQRVIATPSLFASNSRPWKSHTNLDSGIWTLARTLQEAQIQAEARRLFYVACTRVKDLLILAGAPNDSVRTGNEISIKPRSVPMPTFGHMWLDAMGWQLNDEGRHVFLTQSMPFAVHSHVSELSESNLAISPNLLVD